MDDNLVINTSEDTDAREPTETMSPTAGAHKTPISIMTRKSTMVFGLGCAITLDDSEITGSRLPTCGQVLRCLMYVLQEGAPANRTKWESAKIVLAKVAVFFEKANIPMIAERYACEKILKLLDDNAKIRAIPCARRLLPASVDKVKKMETKLDETFALWPSNAEELIKNAEDRAFLLSMKSDRSATFGPKDQVCAAKLKCRLTRDQAECNRRKKMLQEMTASSTLSCAVVSSCIIDSNTDTDTDMDTLNSNNNNDVTSAMGGMGALGGSEKLVDESDLGISGCSTSSRKSHHRTVRCGTEAFIPHDILKRPKLVALATRLRMTPAQQAAYTEALIAESGGNPAKISTSYSTADRLRRTVGDEIARACKDDWVVPRFLTLHWDSKLLPSLCNPNVNEERLTIVVGDKNEMKLLGVPSYQPGTDKKSGQIIMELTTKLLESWHCADNIVNMTFDTTASNTGHVTAACVTIQHELHRALLWSGCRHHIGEVILTHIFNDLKIEVSKSPEITLFQRFKKNFDLMPRSSNALLSRFNSTTFSDAAQRLLADCRVNVHTLACSQLSFQRDDYLEFIQLCRVFLDNDDHVMEQPLIFKRPGALHKARWMFKLLYSIKICLFEEQIKMLPPGTITT